MHLEEKALNGSQILMGARGQKRFDIDAIAEAIVHLSQLLMDFPQIRELDINPLRILHEGEGCLASGCEDYSVGTDPDEIWN